MNDDYLDIVNEWQKVTGGFQPRLQAFKAIMGDGKGNVQGTQSNTVYVRVLNNALGTAPAVQAIEVYNDAAPLIDGLIVMVGYSHDRPRLLHVLSVNDQRTDITSVNGTPTGGVGLAPHGWQHGWLKPDPVAINWRQITDLQVISNGTFVITINGGVIPRTGIDTVVNTQTYDLTSHVPATGAIYCLISLDSTGAVVATDGTNETGISTLTVADIPDTPAGNFRLAAVRLYAGQDYIHEDSNSVDILDRRWPQESLTGSAPGISSSGYFLNAAHVVDGAAYSLNPLPDSAAQVDVSYSTVSGSHIITSWVTTQPIKQATLSGGTVTLKINAHYTGSSTTRLFFIIRSNTKDPTQAGGWNISPDLLLTSDYSADLTTSDAPYTITGLLSTRVIDPNAYLFLEVWQNTTAGFSATGTISFDGTTQALLTFPPGGSVSAANEGANLVYAGPPSGGAAQPSFRGVVAADLATSATSTKVLYGDMTWRVAPIGVKPDSNNQLIDQMDLNVGARTQGLLQSFSKVGLSGLSNPIITLGGVGTSDHTGIREIGNVLFEPFETKRRYKIFYTGYNAGITTDEKVHYAYSDDGKTWTKFASNPITTRRAEDPYVLWVNGVYYLYAEDKQAGGDNKIRRWESTDCETWTDDGQITGLGDAQSPLVWIERNTWYLLYEQYPTTPHDIRLATSTDGMAWTPDATNPVMSPGDTTWVNGSIVCDDIIRIGNTYYMTYHGSANVGDTDFREGIAKSTDLTTWTDQASPFISNDTADQIVTAMYLYDDRLSFYYYTIDTSGIYRGYPMNPTLTLASDAMTIDGDYFIVKSQSGTADNLATINGGSAFQMLVIQPYTGHTITVKHGTGNIYLSSAADVALSGDKTLALFFDGVNWADAGVPGTGGDVVGPGTAVNSNLVAFDGTTGKLIKDSGYKASDFALAGSGGSGGGEVIGIDRWAAATSQTNFDLPDTAEALLIASDNGVIIDPTTVSLSANHTQVVFDTGITAGHIVMAEYVIAQV